MGTERSLPSRPWASGPWRMSSQYGGGGTFWGWHLETPDRGTTHFGAVYADDYASVKLITLASAKLITLAPEMADAILRWDPGDCASCAEMKDGAMEVCDDCAPLCEIRTILGAMLDE